MLHLRVITPRKVVFEGEVEAVVAPSAAGEVTILQRHSDLFSLLTEGVITIKGEKKEDHLAIGGGFLETDGKELNILVSHAYGQNEIDEKLTEKAIKDAEKLVKEAKNEEERLAAVSVLRRSSVNLKLLHKARRRPSARIETS